MSELTAATILDGAQAGEKFLLKGEREAQDFAESHAGTGVFMERLGGSPGLLVFGAGHVSMPIIKIGKMLGFSVTVLEDRPKFADQARRAGADRVLCEPFSRGLAQAELGPDTYAVIVTRGHRYDEDCLRHPVPGAGAGDGLRLCGDDGQQEEDRHGPGEDEGAGDFR